MNYIKPKYLDIPFYMRANILHKECNKSAPKKSNLGRRVRDPFRTTSLKTEFFFLSTSSWVEVLKKKPNNIKVCDFPNLWQWSRTRSGRRWCTSSPSEDPSACGTLWIKENWRTTIAKNIYFMSEIKLWFKGIVLETHCKSTGSQSRLQWLKCIQWVTGSTLIVVTMIIMITIMKRIVKTSKIIMKKIIMKMPKKTSKNLGRQTARAPARARLMYVAARLARAWLWLRSTSSPLSSSSWLGWSQKLNPIKNDCIGDIYELKKGEWFLDHQNQTFFSHYLGCL